MKPKKKRPFDGHPRADETRAAMLAAHFEDEVEVIGSSGVGARVRRCGCVDNRARVVHVGRWVRTCTKCFARCA